MGFISTASTLTLNTKFTPFGRKQLLNNNQNIITKFSLGDSDSNYRCLNALSLGNIPESSGSLTDNINSGISIKHKIVVNRKGDLYKPVENNSVNSNEHNLGVVEISAATNVFKINRNDSQTNELVNLFSTFGLPITNSQKLLFDTITNDNGGFYNTALENLNQDNVLVIPIDNNKFGEIIDGRVLNLTIQTTATTYNIFSTYQKNLNPPEYQDIKTSELNSKYGFFGDKIVFLFSDEIKKPNNDSRLSWGTGFNLVKPFSVNSKEQFNLLSINSLIKDECVGVAYLDKGFVVITNQNIVNAYVNGNIKIKFDSLSNQVSKNINCLVERGEFNSSLNPTYNSNDIIRFSEIGLYDDSNNLIAYGKTNEHVLIKNNDFLPLSVNIIV